MFPFSTNERGSHSTRHYNYPLYIVSESYFSEKKEETHGYVTANLASAILLELELERPFRLTLEIPAAYLL